MSKLLHNFEDNSKSTIDFTINEHVDSPAAILVTLDATHSGYKNKNFFYYDTQSMKYAVSRDVWTSPFPKPLLKNHNLESEPLGRVKAARFIDSDDGKGFTQLDVLVTDPGAIKKILDGRYLTVSTHGAPLKDAIIEHNFTKCSICDTNLNVEEYCGHSRGRVYEDEDGMEKQCFWIVGALDYKEVSIVNTPADNDGQTAAQITAVSMIDGENPASPCDGDSCQTQKSMVFIDSEVKYADEDFLSACDSLAELLVANRTLWEHVKYDKQSYIDSKGLLFDEDVILASLEKKELEKLKSQADCAKEDSTDLKDYMNEAYPEERITYGSSTETGGLKVEHSHVIYYEDELKNGYTDWVFDHTHSVIDGKLSSAIIAGTNESHSHEILPEKLDLSIMKYLLDYTKEHRHAAYVNSAGNGHSSYVDGHSHEIVNNKVILSDSNHVHTLIDWPDDLNDMSDEGAFISLKDIDVLKEQTTNNDIKDYYNAFLETHKDNNKALEQFQLDSVLESIEHTPTNTPLLIGNEAMKQLNDITLDKLNKVINSASTDKVERIKMLIEENSKVSDEVKQAFLETIEAILKKSETSEDAEDATNTDDTPKNSPADLVEALKVTGMDSYLESIKDESFKDGYKVGYEEASVVVSLDDSSENEDEETQPESSDAEDAQEQTSETEDTHDEEQNTQDEEQANKEIDEIKTVLIDSIVHSATVLRKSVINLESVKESQEEYKSSLEAKDLDSLRKLYKELDKDILDAFVNVPTEAVENETISDDKPSGLENDEEPMSDTKKVISSYFKSK